MRMSDLSLEEQQVFEKLFKMEEGNLLNLTTADVGDFFDLNAGIQIHSKPFNEYGFSVGDKIKAFWKIAPNRCVAQINRDLLGLAIRRNEEINQEDLQQAEKILHRLETIDEEPKKESNKPSTKKYHPHSALKGSLLVIAQDLWKENPHLSQSDIMRKNVFKEKVKNLCNALNVQVKEETIRKWIREVDPRNEENKPGPNKKE